MLFGIECLWIKYFYIMRNVHLLAATIISDAVCLTPNIVPIYLEKAAPYRLVFKMEFG